MYQHLSIQDKISDFLGIDVEFHRSKNADYFDYFKGEDYIELRLSGKYKTSSTTSYIDWIKKDLQKNYPEYFL